MNSILTIFLILFGLSAQAEDFILNSNSKISDAPQLTLILNEEYFITQMLAQDRATGKYAEDVKAFQTVAKKISQATVIQFKEYKRTSLEVATSPVFYINYSVFFEKLKKTDEYQNVKQQTIEYMRESISEWDANLEMSTQFMTKYSGFKFNYAARAYITHPAVGSGEAQNAQEKILAFGAWPKFDNYFTIYIWHELIHFHMNLDETSHAVNQLLTDNDLRVFLNGDKLNPLQGHASLKKKMKKATKAWEQYKKSPTDLNVFVKSLN